VDPRDGRSVSIPEYPQLYEIIGATFGGNGQTMFNVPDLRGRVVMGAPNPLSPGGTGGAESIALTATQVPPHNHTIGAVSNATSGGTPLNPVGPPTGAFISEASKTSATGAAPYNLYAPVDGANWAPLNSATLSDSGGGLPHENRQPVLPLQICICAFNGFYPPREYSPGQ